MTEQDLSPETLAKGDKPGAVALLPCPFCGEDAEHASVRDGRQVFCPYCFAKGPPAYHGPANIPTAQERAVDGWNHRAAVAPAVSAQDKPGAEAAKAAHKIQLCTFEDGPEQAIAIIQAAIDDATAAVVEPIKNELAQSEAELDSALGLFHAATETVGKLEQERDEARTAARELGLALKAVLPAETGQYGGPLVSAEFTYEDGDRDGYGHGVVRSARLALAKHVALKRAEPERDPDDTGRLG